MSISRPFANKNTPDRLRSWKQRWNLLCLSFTLLTFSGCGLFRAIQGVSAVPANRVPTEYLARPRSEMLTLTPARLRQDPPKNYRLGPNDILGVYIESVLGEPGSLPEVQFKESDNLPASIGYSFPVRENGTIVLPHVPPIKVAGLTLEETAQSIRKAYTVDSKILPADKNYIAVTLRKRRVHRILVIREETGGMDGVTKRGTGHTVDLPAYENDLLHALNATGGMPGLDANNEILIYHGRFDDATERDRLLASLNANRDPCSVLQPTLKDPHLVKIPLRYFPEEVPSFSHEEIILRTGDIVLIRSRESEKFYTGGALVGGEHLLPRDYEIDILQAIALAGGRLGNSGAGLSQVGRISGGQSGAVGLGGVAPSQAIILRKAPGHDQIAIRVDLNKALEDPTQRIIIQPKDTIIVRYTFSEELYNAMLNMIQLNFLIGGI